MNATANPSGRVDDDAYEHMADAMEEIVHAARGVLVGYTRGELDKNGSAIHEHSTCRMGARSMSRHEPGQAVDEQAERPRPAAE